MRTLGFLLIFVLSLGLLTGCSDDSTPTTPAASPARLSAIHASPDAPGVDLYVDGTKVGSDLMFPNNTPYLSVNAGTRAIAVKVAGTSTTVLSADLPVASSAHYSVFAVDSVSKLSALVLTDDLTAPASGKAHVRFVHLSPNAPAVDVALAGGSVLIGDKAFKQYTSFLPVDAGTYDLEVRLAGTSTVVLPLPGISLTAGKIYTVFAKGFVGGTGAQQLGAQIVVNN